MITRRISPEALLFAGSLTFALALGEVVVRLTADDSVVLYPRNHATAHYADYTLRTMTPNTTFLHTSKDGSWRFTINNKGFRDTKPYHHTKPEGLLRVLVLGDSHTAGFEVHQDATYSAVLERGLLQRGVRVEVLNTGVSGFSTAEQLVFLEHEGLKYKPDVVVVGFFINDFTDNVRADLFRIEGGKLVDTGERHYAPAVWAVAAMQAVPGVKWLSENSYLYSTTFNALWLLAKQIKLGRARAKAGGEEVALRFDTATASETELAIALLKRIGDVARRNGSVPILVDIPLAGPRSHETSLQPALRAALAGAFAKELWSEDYLATLGRSELAHVPRGHRHISEAAHARLGFALAQTIGSMTKNAHAAQATPDPAQKRSEGERQ